MTGAREAAYLALLAAMQEEKYISDSLEDWQRRCHPSAEDISFAREIAAGSCRMLLALEYLAAAATPKGKLALKKREKALLLTALYQYYFMDKVPLYAIANESVAIAKKYCHNRFTSFLNAQLRNLEGKQLSLPQGDDLKSLSIRYSYPLDYVRKLSEERGNRAKELLAATNRPPAAMARLRRGESPYPPVAGSHKLPVVKLPDAKAVRAAASSSDYYIQNITPVGLMERLAEGMETSPGRILDLCASPGGKLLTAADLFPNAELFGNDISEKKVARMRENLEKYDIAAVITQYRGEEYPIGSLFDLILIDAPCSNSGVYHKRPEARWRLDVDPLTVLQKKLLAQAAKLVAPGGEIWYMTCSILADENEAIVKQASKAESLELRTYEVCFPDEEGRDGGFGAALTLR